MRKKAWMIQIAALLLGLYVGAQLLHAYPLMITAVKMAGLLLLFVVLAVFFLLVGSRR